jgi:glycosyltransferase involved in cell wall biosynthesis
MDNHEGTFDDSRSSLRSPAHILHVIASLSPPLGGPPEGLRQLAKASLEIGDTPEVVCLDPPDAPFLKEFPCSVHALGQHWLGRYGFSPRLWSWLRQNVSRFDGIVMQGIWTFPGVAVRAACLRADKPYCNFVHGALDPWFEQNYPLKHLKKKVYWPIQYKILRDAYAVLFTTDTERDLASISFRPNIWNSALIPFGISEPEGDPTCQVRTFYQNFPQLRGRRFLLFMSRLHPKKGCDLLIEAFANVASEFPDVDLVVAGPDEEGAQSNFQRICATKGIADRVFWPGMVSGDIKWGALRAADAFILPSHSENFGIVLAEALAAGRPVLTTNKVNIWQEILEDGAGLIDDDSPHGTDRLLRRWLGMSDHDRAAMAANTRDCFVSRFTMKRAAETINDLFAGQRAAVAALPHVARSA